MESSDNIESQIITARKELASRAIHTAKRMLVVNRPYGTTISIEVLKDDDVLSISEDIMKIALFSSYELYEEIAIQYPNRDIAIKVNDGGIGSYIEYFK